MCCFVLGGIHALHVSVAVKSSGSDFPQALGSVLPPFICAPANSLVRSGAGSLSAGEITEAFKVTRSNLTCQYSCPIPVRGSAGDK